MKTILTTIVLSCLTSLAFADEAALFKARAENFQNTASRAVVGTVLAEQVYAKLMQGSNLLTSHRDYNGTGLQVDKGDIIYGEVYDGLIYEQSTMMVFHAKFDFVDWLSKQSNLSLGHCKDDRRCGNQTLSVERMQEFVNK